MDIVPSSQGVPSVLGASRGCFLIDRAPSTGGSGPPPPGDDPALDFSKAANSQYLGTV